MAGQADKSITTTKPRQSNLYALVRPGAYRQTALSFLSLTHKAQVGYLSLTRC